MLIRDELLPEFEYEMAITRPFFERVPEEHLTWQPHPKSMALGRLAQHLADMPSWVTLVLTTEQMDVANYTTPAPPTARAEILDAFEAGVAGARAVLANASDEDLLAPWSMCRGDEVFFTMPRLAVCRVFAIKHIVHHRAQLGVYFRLLDIPVPSAFGPTADEMM